MKDQGAGKEKHQPYMMGARPKDEPRYKIIQVRGADLLYDTLTGTYYKQFRLPFPGE